MRQLEQFQVSGNAAEHYERYIVPTIFVPWTADLLERAALQSGEQVLDVACGTGIVARHAAQQVGNDGKVTGIDLNPVMLEVPRVQAASSGAVVEWHQGDAGAVRRPPESGRTNQNSDPEADGSVAGTAQSTP